MYTQSVQFLKFLQVVKYKRRFNIVLQNRTEQHNLALEPESKREAGLLILRIVIEKRPFNIFFFVDNTSFLLVFTWKNV